jgi:gas vesicle protein
MTENLGSRVNAGFTVSYFLVGCGIGAVIGILFAPKSGKETRDYLSQEAEKGKEYTQRKARELRERVEDLVERGTDMVMQQKDTLSGAMDAGRKAYQEGEVQGPVGGG